MKVAVLGAGITGVVVTRELCSQGHDVTCFEAADRPGGLCSSEVIDGFVCDRAGGHIIFSKDPAVLAYMLDALEPVGHHTSRRQTFIFEEGGYVTYPYENGLCDLPLEARFACLNDYVEAAFARRNGAPRPDDFKSWCLWRFGEAICKRFMFPYNEKIWNVPLEELGVEWVAGRVPDAPLADVLRSSLGLRTEGYKHQSVFHYPLEGGFESLVRGVVSHIPRGVIRCGTPVNQVEKTNGGWLVDGQPFDRVISTIPLQVLGSILKDVPETMRRAFERLDYVSLVTVFLALDRPEVPQHSWIYFPSPAAGPQNRITYLSNYSPRNAPPGKTSIMAEVTYHRELPASLDQIKEDVVAGLAASGLVERKHVMWARTFQSRYAYILYRKDLERNVAAVRDHCRSIDLDIVGRFGNYNYFNSDMCIRAAFDLSRKYRDQV